jgi:hypothetical protein
MLRSLALVLLLCLVARFAPPACAVDPPGLRTLSSKHLILVTDLDSDAEVDALPGYFDQAFLQWCAYFGIDPAGHDQWQARGFLMQSRERFAAAGLINDQVPQFATGYSLRDAFWLFDQTSVYYRRHLLLHEGVHCFMNSMLGTTGPTWYGEGLAEILATHRLEGNRITVNVIPANRAEVPKWGRIEVVQHDFARRKALTLDKVFQLGGTLHGTVEQYAWCWAAAAFLDHHPRYRQRFRQLAAHVAAPNFTQQAIAAFASDRPRLDEDWQIFVAHLDYGYDFARMDVELAVGRPIAAPAHVQVAADRGWQSSGIVVEEGKRYRLKATGRYQVAAGPPPWMSEPGGVTIRYNQGRPLGMLLAAIRPDDPAANKPSGLIRPVPVGLDAVFTAPRTGTLYLRVNDSAGSLADNAGQAEVEISPLP